MASTPRLGTCTNGRDMTKCSGAASDGVWCYDNECYAADDLCQLLDAKLFSEDDIADVYGTMCDDYFYEEMVEGLGDDEALAESIDDTVAMSIYDIIGANFTPEEPLVGIYYEQDADAIDEDGIYDSLDFNRTSQITAHRIQFLGTGSVGLVQESFEDMFENEVQLYYTTGSDAGPSNDPPTVALDSDDAISSFTYSTSETAALKSRFGADVGGDASDVEAYLEGLISEMTAEIAATQIMPQFTFKKIKTETLDNNTLSTFEDTEAEQTVTTGLTTTTEVSAEDYPESAT